MKREPKYSPEVIEGAVRIRRSRQPVRVTVVSDYVDRCEDRLYARIAAPLGAPAGRDTGQRPRPITAEEELVKVPLLAWALPEYGHEHTFETPFLRIPMDAA